MKHAFDQHVPFPFYHVYEDMKAAIDKDKLEEWVQTHLQHEGNYGLLTALKTEKPIFVGLVKVPIAILNKIVGPEEADHRETLDAWEERVSGITLMIEQGYIPPPLIVTDYWNSFEIVDGNHRHEALLRNAIEDFWTIFFLKHEENVNKVQSYEH